MMKNKGIGYISRLALLIGLIIILTILPLGFIKIGPVEIVLVHIPVIVGALVLGPASGLLLGTAFGIASLMLAPGNALMAPIWSVAPLSVVVICVVPRMLMGLLTGVFARLMGKAFKEKLTFVGDILVGVVGSGLNTALFLSTLWLLGAKPLQEVLTANNMGALSALFATIISVNGVTEAITAAVLVPAICQALRMYTKRQRSTMVR